MTFMSLGLMSMIPALAGANVVLPRNGAKLHWRPESRHALFCRTLDKVQRMAICVTSSCLAVRNT